MEVGPKIYALLWIPAMILIFFVSLMFLPALMSSLPSQYFYFAYLILGLIVFFSLYLFYKKLKGEG